MSARRSILVTSFLVTLLGAALQSGTAAAQAPADVDKAKMLFGAGAQFYTKGEFDSAIRAFEEANKILPRPAIEFSIAQAHRRQYYIDKKPDHLTRAIDNYKRYIAQTPEGGRKFEAAQALGELENIQSRVGGDSAGGGGARPAHEPPKVMVSSSTPGAQVSIDGSAPKPAPLEKEVTAGQHKISVTAPGYFPDERAVIASDNSILPVNADLRERPGHLMVNAPSGSQLTIDGRPVGETPLPRAVDVTPGSHLLAVSRNGRRAFTQDVTIQRDETKQVDVRLQVTSQRVASYVILGAAAAMLVTGGVFIGVGLSRQGEAQDIADRRTVPGRSISTTELAEYESLRDQRNDWVRLGGIALGAGVATAVTGLAFYAFDRPTVSAPARTDDKPQPRTPSSEPIREMRLQPVTGPGVLGGAFTGRF